MAVKIKLKPVGRIDTEIFRIVIADESTKRDGKVLDLIGTYNKQTSPPLLTFDEAKLKRWITLGARPTQSVGKLLNIQI